MTDEMRDIDGQVADRRRKGGSGGATIVQDPRVSQAQTWVFGAVGFGIIAAMTWGASSINRLNETMARIASQNEYIVSTLSDHGDRIKDLERRNAAR